MVPIRPQGNPLSTFSYFLLCTVLSFSGRVRPSRFDDIDANTMIEYFNGDDGRHMIHACFGCGIRKGLRKW